jgi:Mg-chelatase subunit ChlD
MLWKNRKAVQKVRSSEDNHLSISQKSIEISHKGEPISAVAFIGYVYLIVDCSASMEGNKLKQAKRGTLNFAKDALDKGYLTGLIRFDSSAKLICEPFKEITILEKSLASLEIGDTTHMAKAINLAHRLLEEMSGNRLMVIVTDGMPNGPGDPTASLSAGESAKRSEIDIIAIGTDDADKEFLKRLASRTELGIKVSSKQLEKTISSSAKMLPAGDRRVTKK